MIFTPAMLFGLGLVALVACGFLEKPLERLAAFVVQLGALWALRGAVLLARWEAQMASRPPVVATRRLPASPAPNAPLSRVARLGRRTGFARFRGQLQGVLTDWSLAVTGLWEQHQRTAYHQALHAAEAVATMPKPSRTISLASERAKRKPASSRPPLFQVGQRRYRVRRPWLAKVWRWAEGSLLR